MRKVLISAYLVGCSAIYADIDLNHARDTFFTYAEWDAIRISDHQDTLYLNDGTIIKGTLTFLPSLNFSFGKIDFAPDKVTLAAFRREGNQIKAQYISNAGENYIGSLKNETVKLLIGVGNYGYRAESNINPKDINFILLGSHGLVRSTELLLSIQFRNGDQLPFTPLKQTIALSENDKIIELPVHNIEDITIDGYVKGIVKDGAKPRELEHAALKDKYISLYVPASKETFKIPWENVSRIQAGRNGFIQQKRKFKNSDNADDDQHLAFASEAFDAFLQPIALPKEKVKNIDPVAGDAAPGASVSYGTASGQTLISPKADAIIPEKHAPKKNPEIPKRKVQTSPEPLAYSTESYKATQRPLTVHGDAPVHLEPLFPKGSQSLASTATLSNLQPLTSMDLAVIKKDEVKPIRNPEKDATPLLTYVDSFESPIQVAFDFETNIENPTLYFLDTNPENFNDIAWLTDVPPGESISEEPDGDDDHLAFLDLNTLNSDLDHGISPAQTTEEISDKPAPASAFGTLDAASLSQSEPSVHAIDAFSPFGIAAYQHQPAVRPPSAASEQMEEPSEGLAALKPESSPAPEPESPVMEMEAQAHADIVVASPNPEPLPSQEPEAQAIETETQSYADLFVVDLKPEPEPAAELEVLKKAVEASFETDFAVLKFEPMPLPEPEEAPGSVMEAPSATDIVALQIDSVPQPGSESPHKIVEASSPSDMSALMLELISVQEIGTQEIPVEASSPDNIADRKIGATDLQEAEQQRENALEAAFPSDVAANKVELKPEPEINDNILGAALLLEAIMFPTVPEAHVQTIEPDIPAEPAVVQHEQAQWTETAQNSTEPVSAFESIPAQEFSLAKSETTPASSINTQKESVQIHEKVSLAPEDIIKISDELVFEHLEIRDVDPVEFTVPTDDSDEEEEGFSPLNYQFASKGKTAHDELVALGPLAPQKKEQSDEELELSAANYIWHLISD